MFKPVYPGKLKGKSDSQIEDYLEELWGFPVEYTPYEAHVFAFDDFDTRQGAELCADMRKLTHVADCTVACQKGRVFLRVCFNDIAVDVISGEKDRREAAKRKAATQLSKETP